LIAIRYADDTIVGFQHEHEAKAFLHDLQERMRAFELGLTVPHALLTTADEVIE
jgi:hypothetical protein